MTNASRLKVGDKVRHRVSGDAGIIVAPNAKPPGREWSVEWTVNGESFIAGAWDRNLILIAGSKPADRIAIRFDSAARRTANTRFGFGLHYGNETRYTKLDAAWHIGFTAAVESEFADVHPPLSFSASEREHFYQGRREGYRELEHQEEQARLATVGDAVLASNRYDRDEVRGGWGHDASESELLMAV